MTKKIKIIAIIPDDEVGLVPFVILVPDWLPSTRDVARMMVNDIHDDFYCSDAWLMDDSWSNESIKSALNLMDWGKAEVLEYDWDEVCPHFPPEKKFNPFEIWRDYGDSLRAKELEPIICKNDKDAEAYARSLPRHVWSEWTSEELVRHPCWMFYYAKNVCKGRLPEVLDNAMMMKSFENSEDRWIKRYFGTKRYRTRNRKALASIPWAA